VRVPEVGLLDIHAKIAANNVVKQRLVEMAKRYGKEALDTLFEQLIRYSDERVAAKLALIPEGRWTSVNYIEGRREPTLKVQVTAIKQNGRLILDFTGTSPQTSGSENMAPAGSVSSAVAPFVSMVCHEIPWNEGLFERIEVVLPEGSLVNPKRPAAVSAGVPAGANMLTMTASLNVISKMLFSSDELRKEACGNVTGGFFCAVFSGVTRDGRYFTTPEMDHLAGGTGGWQDHDGTSAAQNTWSVKTMITNVEMAEMLFPLMYLWRSLTPDSGGLGKYRGGLGLENAFIPWGTDHLDIVTLGVGSNARPCLGFSGGYPASHTPAGIMHDAGIREIVSNGARLPCKFTELTGTWEKLTVKGVTSMGANDVIYGFVSSGGGGFGDPTDRDPNLVLSDLHDSFVNEEVAHSIYGVVIGADGRVDETATKERRKTIRNERLIRSRQHASA
jgi:N-methylhydantoinase B